MLANLDVFTPEQYCTTDFGSQDLTSTKSLRSRIEGERAAKVTSCVLFDLVRRLINGLPAAKSRRAVVVGEAAGKADIVALDGALELPSEVLDDAIKRGIDFDEIHGVLHRGTCCPTILTILG
jgi:hypothetical protein